MNVAIFGAAGAVGPVVIPELLARGHRVRVVGRDLARLRCLGPGLDAVAADLTDAAGAAAGAAGMDAIVYAVGVPYHRFALHPAMMRTTLAAARAAGVRELIHVSNVYPYGRPRTTPVAETHPLEPRTRKGRWRKEQEDLVLAAHDPNGLRTLIVRPPDFYGPHAENGLASLALARIKAGKPADLLGPIDTPHEWIYLPDLGPIVAALVDRPDAFGTAYNLPSAGTLTERAFATALFAAAGKPLRYRVATPLMLRGLGLFNATMRELVEMSYLYETPVLLDAGKLRGILGDVRTTPYDVGIRATVAAALGTPAAA